MPLASNAPRRILETVLFLHYLDGHREQDATATATSYASDQFQYLRRTFQDSVSLVEAQLHEQPLLALDAVHYAQTCKYLQRTGQSGSVDDSRLTSELAMLLRNVLNFDYQGSRNEY